MNQQLKRVKDIYENIDKHFSSTGEEAHFEHDDLWDAWVAVEWDYDDEDQESEEQVKYYAAHDNYNVERFRTFEEAFAWIKESAEIAIEATLSELKSNEAAISDIADETVEISTAYQGSGYQIFSIADVQIQAAGSTDIIDDTFRKNMVTTTVRKAHEIYGINAQYLRDTYNEVSDLLTVMTASEVADTYGIADATVRQTIARGAIRARKSGSTWLILRSDAERFWNRNATKGVTTWMLTVLAVLAIVSQL